MRLAWPQRARIHKYLIHSKQNSSPSLLRHYSLLGPHLAVPLDGGGSKVEGLGTTANNSVNNPHTQQPRRLATTCCLALTHMLAPLVGKPRLAQLVFSSALKWEAIGLESSFAWVRPAGTPERSSLTQAAHLPCYSSIHALITPAYPLHIALHNTPPNPSRASPHSPLGYAGLTAEMW